MLLLSLLLRFTQKQLPGSTSLLQLVIVRDWLMHTEFIASHTGSEMFTTTFGPLDHDACPSGGLHRRPAPPSSRFPLQALTGLHLLARRAKWILSISIYSTPPHLVYWMSGRYSRIYTFCSAYSSTQCCCSVGAYELWMMWIVQIGI